MHRMPLNVNCNSKMRPRARGEISCHCTFWVKLPKIDASNQVKANADKNVQLVFP